MELRRLPAINATCIRTKSLFSPCCPVYLPNHSLASNRRRFLQAVENRYGKAEPLLKIIQELYQIERVAKERAEKKGTETALFQERKNARRQSQKFVREFFEQCRVLKESERPSSPVAQAVSYALNIEEELKKFLKDARLNIDNNPALFSSFGYSQDLAIPA